MPDATHTALLDDAVLEDDGHIDHLLLMSYNDVLAS